MIPIHFDQANARLGPPPDLEESQCLTISAYIGQAKGGSIDGAAIAVVAWQPSESDLRDLNNGGLIYLSMIGGVPPHFLSTDFNEATKPS